MLRIRSNCYEGLPVKAVLEKFGNDAENEEEEQGEVLVASVGVEFTNRRRNKFAGQILRVGFVENDETEFDLEVFHSFGEHARQRITLMKALILTKLTLLLTLFSRKLSKVHQRSSLSRTSFHSTNNSRSSLSSPRLFSA